MAQKKENNNQDKIAAKKATVLGTQNQKRLPLASGVVSVFIRAAGDLGDTSQVGSEGAEAARGPGVVVNAVAPDGVIEGIEAPAYRFCLGVQWHPEFAISPGDPAIFKAFVAAAA